jgi:hypothetical protein
LVGKAFSQGENLELVLYPGTASGPQAIEIERLKPGRRYSVTGAVQDALTADARGRAQLTVNLHGRTAVAIVPLSTH